MSGFSADWLALREPVDRRSRNATLGQRLAQHFAGRPQVTVTDLGCGTGANLRATAPLLGSRQQWTLVDYDDALLVAARGALQAWADKHEAGGEELVLVKDDKHLTVRFRRADLQRAFDAGLGEAPDLVTASAFFDLCSTSFIARMAIAVAARRAAFYTVLTYNGMQSWTPAHAADGAMLEAFVAHQLTDKGFGAAAGPHAPGALRTSFLAVGYDVIEGDSPWRLGPDDDLLIANLGQGFAGAVRQIGRVPAAAVDDWQAHARNGAVVGHADTLALP